MNVCLSSVCPLFVLGLRRSSLYELGGRVERATVDADEDLVELVDEAGCVIGHAARTTVHHAQTPRHRAFSVYLTDDAGRVLLTRSAEQSHLAWCLVQLVLRPSSSGRNGRNGHPPSGREELGVEVRNVEAILPDFSYTATDPHGLVENESCPVYRASIVDTGVTPRPGRGDGLPVAQLARSGRHRRAGAWLLSPWAVAQVQSLSPQQTASMPQRVPSAHAADVTVTLAGVQRLLHEQISELTRLWRELDDGQPPDVLAQDLPAWLNDLLQQGGKRIRPAMCHWGYVASGGEIDRVGHAEMVRAATALELLHQFALLHDDVMDESDLRRGRPAAHRQAERWHAQADARGDSSAFGRNLAVLLGDLALVQAHRLVATLTQLRELWYELCVELVLGQRGDLTGAAAGRRDRSHAKRLAQLKSGSYTVARPLALGAAAAGGTAAAHRALHRFGGHAGVAFALRDEVLGVWGDPVATGKPVGDDLREEAHCAAQPGSRPPQWRSGRSAAQGRLCFDDCAGREGSPGCDVDGRGSTPDGGIDRSARRGRLQCLADGSCTLPASQA